MTNEVRNDPMGIQSAFEATKQAITEARAGSQVTQEGVDTPDSAPVEVK